MNQRTIFELVEEELQTLDVVPTSPRVLSRRTDPETSAMGARDVSYRSGSQKARLLAAYQQAGAMGMTDEQAAKATGMALYGATKRCADLRNDGKIEPVPGELRRGSAGSLRMVCRVVT